MKKEKLYNSLTNINDEFIEEMLNASTKAVVVKKKRVKYFISVAACIVLIFSTVSVFAKTGWGTQIIDMFTSRKQGSGHYTESGYDLLVDIEKIPVRKLGEVRQVSKIILKQISEYEPWESWLPTVWYQEYSTSREAIAFIGLKSLQELNWDLEEQGTSLTVRGNREGELRNLYIETNYETDNIRLQAFSHIYLEGYGENITYENRTTENVSYEETYYISKNDFRCHILTSTVLQSGYLCKDGYIVKDGVLYSLHIVYQEQDKEQAEELMCQWADLF